MIVEHAKQQAQQCLELMAKKRADYGTSFEDLYKEFGLLSTVVRLHDKVARLKNITSKGGHTTLTNESIEDTLRDTANYCLLTLAIIRMDREARATSRYMAKLNLPMAKFKHVKQ